MAKNKCDDYPFSVTINLHFNRCRTAVCCNVYACVSPVQQQAIKREKVKNARWAKQHSSFCEMLLQTCETDVGGVQHITRCLT